MTITREAVDRRTVDFAGVTSGRRLPPVHPGRFLRDEFLEPLGLSVYALAEALNVPRPRLNDVVRGRRSVSTDTALRLARYFGTSPRSSGSISRSATTSTLPNAPCAAPSTVRSSRVSPDRPLRIVRSLLTATA